MPAWLVSGESSLLGLNMAPFSLCPPVAFPLCMCAGEENFLAYFLIRTLILWDQTTLVTSFNLFFLIKNNFRDFL